MIGVNTTVLTEVLEFITSANTNVESLELKREELLTRLRNPEKIIFLICSSELYIRNVVCKTEEQKLKRIEILNKLNKIISDGNCDSHL